jgi:CBS domain-containing protein
VVSEGDIIRKLQGLTPDKGGLFDWIFGTKKEPAAKLAARTAGEAMTAPPVTIEPDSTVSDAGAPDEHTPDQPAAGAGER